MSAFIFSNQCNSLVIKFCTGQLKCDGTRAETRFHFSAKRTSPFKSAGASVQSTTSSRGVRISGSNAGYTMLWGSVKGTGYPLHSPVSPSLPLPVRHRVPSYFNWTLLKSKLLYIFFLPIDGLCTQVCMRACVSLCTCFARVFMVELLKNCGHMGCGVMRIPTFWHNLLPHIINTMVLID